MPAQQTIEDVRHHRRSAQLHQAGARRGIANLQRTNAHEELRLPTFEALVWQEFNINAEQANLLCDETAVEDYLFSVLTDRERKGMRERQLFELAKVWQITGDMEIVCVVYRDAISLSRHGIPSVGDIQRATDGAYA